MAKGVFVDVTGMRSGMLVAVEHLGYGRWRCICDCGKECVTRGTNIANGTSKSCGCQRGEAIKRSKTKHGALTHRGKCPRLYYVWTQFRGKCRSEKTKGYSLYGGRGIKYAQEWDDYGVFREWAISNGYKDGLALHRYDETGDFTPENCYWGERKGGVSRKQPIEIAHIEEVVVGDDDHKHEDELWVAIPNANDAYEVSNYGRVCRKTISERGDTRTIKRRILKPCDNGNGYKYVSVTIDGHMKHLYIHRLVASAFIENQNPDSLTVVDHIDHDRSNNLPFNLRWCTQKENVNHSAMLMSKPRQKAMTNTGERYISRQKNGRYRVTVSGKQIGAYQTLDEAIEVRDNALKEAVIVSDR